MIRATIAAICFSITGTGCALSATDSVYDPDSATPALLRQDLGGVGCEVGQALCFAWSGSTQVQGTCTAAGVCCTGCIDSRGTCLTGALESACGRGGVACQNCDDENPCTANSCISGECNWQLLRDGSVCAMFPTATCHYGACY